MKRTGDPLKKIEKQQASADATRTSVPNLVNRNVGTREKITNIPIRFNEKKEEQHRFMIEHGYAPVKNDKGEITEYRLQKGYSDLSEQGKKNYAKGMQDYYGKVDKSKAELQNKKYEEYQRNHPSPKPTVSRDKYGNEINRGR